MGARHYWVFCFISFLLWLPLLLRFLHVYGGVSSFSLDSYPNLLALLLLLLLLLLMMIEIVCMLLLLSS